MTRTNIEIDDEARAAVISRFLLETEREAVNLTLRRLTGEALSVDKSRSLRGSGWDGDLEEMRTSRVQ